MSFPENIVLNYKASVTQNDIDKILNSSVYKAAIAKMNKEQRGFKIALFSKSDFPLEEKLKYISDRRFDDHEIR